MTVDQGVADMLQAIGTSGMPGAFTGSATNPLSMDGGGSLAAQDLANVINQGFSASLLTVTGLDGLSLVNMRGVSLDGAKVTAAQASLLNGQADVQVDIAAEFALGDGTLSYGLSYGQLADLLTQLNGSFDSCGPASSFAQAHLYQPYVTSNAFTGKRPSDASTFAPKPTYNTFQGQVIFVGRGCPANTIPPDFNNSADPYLADPSRKIALIERGACPFYDKLQTAELAGATAAIVFNSASGGESLFTMGAAPGRPALSIPAAFVQRSTGLLLENGSAPVTAFVQQ